MQFKGFALSAFILAFGLSGCQEGTETKPAPGPAPIWYLQSYDANKGFTFSKNMMAEYVAACLEPSQTGSTLDANGRLVFVEFDCTELLPHAGMFEKLSVTISGNTLLVETKERKYHFKITAVRSPLDCKEKGEE